MPQLKSRLKLRTYGTKAEKAAKISAVLYNGNVVVEGAQAEGEVPALQPGSEAAVKTDIQSNES